MTSWWQMSALITALPGPTTFVKGTQKMCLSLYLIALFTILEYIYTSQQQKHADIATISI
jgi:hypothetical protein